ncbi:type VI secretion system baseplate subunit TssE [Sansalvadorimonas sp. 2012CJ34-2]|uniref:Type VI secretion system baseplate subunit TssE n=1 Tax=Parendozoicomonas callyspongiae TaxID=2942213 RepID=A0ABT0PD80_9GAMM|nr:type VI secretion system baseplate subunit TssE [Sansalvadorimonas sp. 2012CJ34-2]MCL6269334.1 type VI secretion system baseplate subunit TssE [Sansalvadorimonas sp. 2012CJ34-2]
MYNKNEKKLMAPVLDRLLQHERGVQVNYLKLKQLRESVRRDLEHMMNTRYRCVSPPDELGQVRKGIPNYGLPDLSTINLNSSEALNKFCRQVADAVRHYEPRIKSIKVESAQSIDPEDPTIRFRMEAVLHANPSQELLIFDSALDPVTQTIDILEMR